nr:MAG: replication associated protein [Cressdnaviricota sp.]
MTDNTAYHHFLCTWNDPPADYLLHIQKTFPTFYASQEEQETRHHVHVYLYYKKTAKKKKSLIRLLPHCDVRGIAPDDAQNAYKYCTLEKPEEKRHTILPDTQHEWGDKPTWKNSHTNQKDKYAETLRFCKDGTWEFASPEHQVKHLPNLIKLAAHYTKPSGSNTTRGIWIYGQSGSGKSCIARTAYGTAETVYLKSQNKWWDNYRAQPTVILDDFDTQGACLGHYLKIWGDHYGAHGEVKGGSVALQYDRLVITSQYRPEDIWTDQELVTAIKRRYRMFTVRGTFPDFELVEYAEFDPRIGL